MAETRLIRVVADLHCGSTMGLCPSEARVVDGAKYTPNALQRWTWAAWEDFHKWADRVSESEPWDLVVNGDAPEGVHHRTKQLVSLEVADHCALAVEVLAPLAEKARKVYLVRGTEAHVGQASESGIGAMLGAEKEKASGYYAAHRWTLRMGAVRIAFEHHITATKRKYLEASGLGIELGNQQLEAARVGEPVDHVLCVAHRHRFGVYTDGFGMTVVSPAWQLSTNYGHQYAPGAIGVVGGYLLDGRGKKDGELPDVRHRLYVLRPRSTS